MNMALQKFAHGATHYCKFKHTALCENALHYDNKTTINKQILWRFQKTFFQTSKKWNTPFYLQMFCALSGRSLSWNTPVFSRFTPRKHANFIICHFFHTHMLPHHSKTQLWDKVISRLSKELKSDPDSCPLVWAPCWKFGWRHHISSSGCGPDCTGFFSKTTEFMGVGVFYLFIYLFIFYQFCLFICCTEDHTCTVVNNGTCAVLSAHTVIWRQRSFIQVFYVSASVLSMDRSSSYRRSSYS